MKRPARPASGVISVVKAGTKVKKGVWKRFYGPAYGRSKKEVLEQAETVLKELRANPRSLRATKAMYGSNYDNVLGDNAVIITFSDMPAKNDLGLVSL